MRVCQIGQETGSGEQGAPAFSQLQDKQFKWCEFWVNGKRSRTGTGEEKKTPEGQSTQNMTAHISTTYHAGLEKVWWAFSSSLGKVFWDLIKLDNVTIRHLPNCCNIQFFCSIFLSFSVIDFSFFLLPSARPALLLPREMAKHWFLNVFGNVKQARRF